ncbi:hypothetical protein ACIN5110_0666 [Acinetobacter baumannii OIFC110]|nr:hypothetical protein ACIN5110_0666 [Acinetobacter baumannii OIFC110]EXA58405.1 hypothetical protein J505_0782 [Acinetobacter baumannii 1297549]
MEISIHTCNDRIKQNHKKKSLSKNIFLEDFSTNLTRLKASL